MSRHGKVLMAMSGGIDSSVAAMLLHEQGYEVIGMTMKTWDYASSHASKKETGCCSLDSINDARAVAVSIGFPHYILDIRAEFGQAVIDNFVDEYLAGRTPNPCIKCNTHIKWDALMKRANMLGCQYIATGHHARIRQENNRFILSKGADQRKDQSYVLWGLKQEVLQRTLFPVGIYTKAEIRQMAEQMGFTELARKSESYEICFIPDNDYRSFLKKRRPEQMSRLEGGYFVSVTGKKLGQHRGYPFYTIGQRKGLHIALGKPMYVTAIHPETNTVVLGTRKDLEERHMTVGQINLIKYPELPQPVEAVIKIRYRDEGTPGTVTVQDTMAQVHFHAPVTAITPGQSAVFYEGNDVIGGGFILNSNTGSS
jgi:tRNA-specific 2-thiouridylase